MCNRTCHRLLPHGPDPDPSCNKTTIKQNKSCKDFGCTQWQVEPETSLCLLIKAYVWFTTVKDMVHRSFCLCPYSLFSTLFCPFCLPFLFFNPVVIYYIIIICCLLTTNNSNILSIHKIVIISYKMLLKTRTNRLSIFFFFFLSRFLKAFLVMMPLPHPPRKLTEKEKKKTNAYTKEEWEYKEEIQYCVLTHKEKQWVKCWAYHWLEWKKIT